MTTAIRTSLCFHCGDKIPADCDLTVTIEERAEPVCCIGCKTVAQLLVASDMTAFYLQRTDYAPQPGEVDQSVVNWFRDGDWVASFSQETPTGIQLPLLVTGMTCAACTWVIEKFLLRHDNVIEVDINLSQSRALLTLKPNSDPAPPIETLLSLGYGARPWRTDERLTEMREESRRDLRRLGVAGVGMMQVGMFAIALHAGALQGIDPDIQQLLRGFSAPLAIFVVLYSGRDFFSNAWQHFRHGALVMDSSVAIALSVATVASLWATVNGGGDTYYDSVTMFVFFLLLARFVEKRLRDADLIALVKLEDSLPEFVNLLKDDQWQRVPREKINIGDRLRIGVGDGISFDGLVLSGYSALEESVFTGESVPRSAGPGEKVFAGTVNQEGNLDIEVLAGFRESRLAGLVSDVERARLEKPPHLQLIDKIAARFVGFVLLAAAGTTLAWWLIDPSRALWTGIAVLVVACPCALSLATPAAVASATARLRGLGIRVRGEFGLLAAAEVDSVLIDKTGTLTQTQLDVSKVVHAAQIDRDSVLGLAAALQQFSNHPAAQAFHQLPSRTGVSDVELVPGAGVTGRWSPDNGSEDHHLTLGSLNFCSTRVDDLPPPPDTDHYWVALVSDRQWLAWIGLSESLRPGGKACIEGIRALGLDILMLSGDQTARVAAIAQQLGIPYRAALSPEGKLSILTAMQSQGQRILAVGDGLNDAPLLGAADASVAVAGATALAKAQADFLITDDDLSRLPLILAYARTTRRIMRQNLVWAASYNVIGIPFAALGYVAPWIAALGMSLSSVLVVLNALRLRRMAI